MYYSLEVTCTTLFKTFDVFYLVCQKYLDLHKVWKSGNFFVISDWDSDLWGLSQSFHFLLNGARW